MTAAARLSALLALAEKATPGPWRQGRTLLTRQTQRWTPEEIVRNDAIEAAMVFAHFTEADEGRSRVQVANVLLTTHDAALIAACSPEVVAALVQNAIALRAVMCEHHFCECAACRATRALDAALGAKP